MLRMVFFVLAVFIFSPSNGSSNSGSCLVYADKFSFIVAKDGSGDFEKIQDAIDASKAFPPERITIYIKNGVYEEKVKVHEWNTLMSLVGESKELTIITYSDFFDKINKGRNSTFYTPTLSVEADDFYARNLTIRNEAGKVGQAVALSIVSNRSKVEDCRILGNQDTVYASGEGNRQYFLNCEIEGTTDFIFGSAVAFFESCIIRSLDNSFITAASTNKDEKYGFVFKDCKLIAIDGVDKVYLGRPWRTYAQTVFINCEMRSHILPAAWDNWNNKDAEKSGFYGEYDCTGPGFKPAQRVKWSHQLSKSQAKKYKKKMVLHSSLKKKKWYELQVNPLLDK